MNFLFLKTVNASIDIAWSLMELGHKVDCIEEFFFDPNFINNQASNKLDEVLTQNTYDFVVCYMFNPSISNICNNHKVKYISWTYDSPLTSLFSDAINNDCNITFIFDKSEYERLKAFGATNIYYMPLGVNMSRIGGLEINNTDVNNYSSDISFVGNLYDENFYNEIISYLPDIYKKELTDYLNSNMCKWTSIKSWPVVSEELCKFILSTFTNINFNSFNLSTDQYLGLLILSRKLAEVDRVNVLNFLGQNHKVDLYTNSSVNKLQNISVHKSVEYLTEMNKVFYCSKINLNVTLPSIETGIPQRIFDIMGCGGFVLTNYQQELDTLFEIGKDIEVFHNLDELKDKANFYLSRDLERTKIGINGYKKVRDNYSYIDQVTKILKIAQEY